MGIGLRHDTAGNRIEAHAAGMLLSHSDNRWYWYGESKKTSDLTTHGVNCYSAPALGGPWRFEGQLISQKDIVVPGNSGPWVIERPKVLFNNVTNNFVMWFHLDDAGYQFRHAGVATAVKPQGPFTFVHALQPDNIPSLDMSLFRDPVDGVAYFVRSCDNKYAGISRLTSDYLNSTGLISQHDVFEGMALFRASNGTYYIVTSHLTGWDPNPLMLFRAQGPTLDDPQWVNMGNPTNSATSFTSQPTFVVPITTSDGQQYFMYMADNWVHGGPGGLLDASYIWLPIDLRHADHISIPKLDRWTMDDPFACPVAGQSVFLRPCNNGNGGTDHTGGLSDQRWILLETPTNTHIALEGAPAYCLQLSSGLIVVGKCANVSAQMWSFSLNSNQIISRDGGQCMDVTMCGNHVCEGEPLAVYACGDANKANQQFTYDATSKRLVAVLDGHCLAACPANYG